MLSSRSSSSRAGLTDRLVGVVCRWVPRRKEAKATKTDEFRKELDGLQGGQAGPGQQGGGRGGGGQQQGGGKGQRFGGPSPQPQVRREEKGGGLCE